MHDVDVCSVTHSFPSADQAVSFAAYLHRHGYNAMAELNEVTCPLSEELEIMTGTVTDIYQLRKTWMKWWQYEDSEVFGLPVFVKNDCSDCVEAER